MSDTTVHPAAGPRWAQSRGFRPHAGNTTVTADPYAADLIGRSAAAYASGVPDDAADDGFFGPASVTWRMSADLALPVAGLRSLLMQALHPLAMAGVDQHSDWGRDPVGRLAATSAYLTTVTFGDQAVALRDLRSTRPDLPIVLGGPAVGGSLPRERGGMRVLERIDESVEAVEDLLATAASTAPV